MQKELFRRPHSAAAAGAAILLSLAASASHAAEGHGCTTVSWGSACGHSWTNQQIDISLRDTVNNNCVYVKGNLAGYGYDHAQWKDQTRVCGYNNVRRYQAWTPYNVIGMRFYRDDWWNPGAQTQLWGY